MGIGLASEEGVSFIGFRPDCASEAVAEELIGAEVGGKGEVESEVEGTASEEVATEDEELG